MYRKYLKRPLDIVLSFCGLIVLSPVMLVLAFLVKTKLGSPVIFCQERPGKDEKIFKMYKFRSMTDARDENGELLSDDVRLTPFGKKLRSSSLDELPELWNILKGDMSVVGPRPQLIRDMWFMTDVERKRHSVSPGLTGLAQVSGRNNISWEEKFLYDGEYIANITFFSDLNIFMKTILKTVKKEDISTEGMETAEDLGVYLLRSGRITQDEFEKVFKIGSLELSTM